MSKLCLPKSNCWLVFVRTWPKTMNFQHHMWVCEACESVSGLVAMLSFDIVLQCAQVLLPGVRIGHQAAPEPSLPYLPTEYTGIHPQLLLNVIGCLLAGLPTLSQRHGLNLPAR